MAKGPHIDAAKVRRIADLAQLLLSDEEVVFYQKQLEKILNYVGQLETIAVKKGPLSPLLTAPERDDTVGPSLDAEVAVAQAAVSTGTSFRVPRIVE